MKATEKLELYLTEFRQRLKKLVILQGFAAIAAVILAVSLIAAWFSLENGYASSTVTSFRLLLILALAAVVIKAILEPLKRIHNNASKYIEGRSAKIDGSGFKGRLETYAQMEQNNPFRELLAEDALKISESYPASEQVKNKDMQIAGLTAAAMLAVLIYMAVGAGLFSYSLQNFLAGWASDSFLPPQSITVLPGDESVRRGANLRINAQIEGFDPDEATLHVRNDGEDWQEVPLVRTMNGFEFTLFSLQEEMEYYVSTTGLRSPDFTVQVVDLPSIENLELTYFFPDWTERETETSNRGDIEALPETRIGLNITTSGPLPAGELILNNTAQELDINGLEASTEFTILEEGQYYIAAIVGGEQVRLSDDYFISLAEDGSPVIEFVRPGQDWNATNIEEVLARVEASDDYGLESLLIKYSINGGDWQEVDLYEPADELSVDYIFMLENMRTVQTRTAAAPQLELGAFDIVLEDSLLPGQEGEDITLEIAGVDSNTDMGDQEAQPAFDEIPLKPGDLISYYAEASDRSQAVQTDMYFIQIQAYNRRYTQSQLSGGGGGGGGGGPTDEISQRQRQIVVSTWNLIREQSEGNNGQVEINSTLLSELQLTLAEQAQTLTDRARARQLNQQDEDIERFVESMGLAIQAMFPSSEKLAAVELQDAIQPAQEALQHLLQAEAVFNDMQVGQQQSGGGGGGGSRASQDLAEMFELEMDMEQNQYETGQSASAQAQQEQVEDIMSQLDELARRQEQLANNMRNQQQLTEAQQYQQEMLRREAEQLQEQLEQLQQQQLGQQGQQQASNQQQGQQGQAGQQGQPGQQNQQGQAGQQGQQTAQNELQQRLESAIRAMNETEEAMANNPGSDELQRAAEEAQRQLEGARDQLAQDQIASMQDSFASMAEQSSDMLLAQERMQQQLQEAMERALEERESGENPNSRGMSLMEEMELADMKEELAADLQRLQQQMMNTMQQFGDETPAATRALAEGNETIAERELELALSDAALYIDAGYALYIAGNERNVTEGMRALNESLERAEQLAMGALNGDSDLEQALEQAEELRDQLAQLPQQQNGQASESGQGQQGQGGQQGQPGQGQQQGQQGGFGGGPDGITNGLGISGWSGNGSNNAFDGPIDLPENFYDNLDNLTELTRDAIPEMQMSQEQIDELLDVIRELEFSRVNRNDDIVLEEYNNMLALIEQLELSLRAEGSNASNPNNVRTAVLDMIPEEYQESVAEYYRRLSRANN